MRTITESAGEWQPCPGCGDVDVHTVTLVEHWNGYPPFLVDAVQCGVCGFEIRPAFGKAPASCECSMNILRLAWNVRQSPRAWRTLRNAMNPLTQLRPGQWYAVTLPWRDLEDSQNG